MFKISKKYWNKYVRAHFRASLVTSEYANTTNLFPDPAAVGTQELLVRCDKLLASYADDRAAAAAAATTTTAAAATQTNTSATAAAAAATATSTSATQTQTQTPTPTLTTEDLVHLPKPRIKPVCSELDHNETGCYLAMWSTSVSAATAAATTTTTTATASKSSSVNSLSASQDYVDVSSNQSLNSDKTFRCSQTQQTEPSHQQQQQQEEEEDQQLYDICQHPQLQAGEDETQQVFAHEVFINCPYADLPAGHLALQRSIKYGQLHRIEKRLFFDQSKKYYCGILNDWMLCYSDGPTSCRPSSSLYLKSSAIEIEHFGEGKRRDICFQITTADPSKKFIYQANNEVDAKEWIHAIEAAIRGDAGAPLAIKMLRKLPTPPLARKQMNNNNSYAPAPQSDCIYEEPSPIYNFGEPDSPPPRLPDKSNSPRALAKRYEYDVPKYPPQPLMATGDETIVATTVVASATASTPTATATAADIEVETTELLNGGTGIGELKPQPSSLHGTLASLDFQAKIKSLHSELSSQLTSPERLKKAVKKSYSSSSASSGNSNSNNVEPEMLSLTSPVSTPIAIVKDQQKKQRKSLSQTPSKECDKLARNWFLSRLNKSTSSTRSTSSVSSNSTATPANAKCKQSEKENLLNGIDACDGNDQQQQQQQSQPQQQQQQQLQQQQQQQQHVQISSNPSSPCLKGDSKSKVNMIINKFENSPHLTTMFSVEALAANALASLTSFCETDNCNNYEPIVPLSSPPSSFLKKV